MKHIIKLIVLLLTNLVFAQSKGYDVLHYSADLTILRADTSIDGSVTMTARTERALGGILQHAKFLTIDSIFVNGIRATFNVVDAASGAYNVIAPEELPNNTEFTVKTYYHGKGKPESGPSAWGGVQHDGNIMYAVGVGFHNPYISCTRHWLPCYDLPDDKADSVALSISTQGEDFVASNGELLQVIDDLPLARKQYVWNIRHPIATYLLTFAIGKFEHVATANPKNIPFDSYALASDTAKVARVMSKRVVNALVFFDSLFAPYPFEKVGYVVADIGSMEHQTMITLARAVLDTNMTSSVHELAHMWWGDWVTCKDFNDPWLNEGFATYCEALFLERFFGKTSYWKAHKGNISTAIAAGSAIPLYGTPWTTKPSSNYPSPVIYNKGAAVLGMLRYFIGDSLFFTAVREYGKRHAYSTATSYDLEAAFEDVTHQDLDWFFKKWVFGTGYPKLRVTWSRAGNDVTVNFEDTSSKGYFRLPLVVEAMAKSGQRERHTVWLDSTKYSTATFAASFVPDSIIVDPDGAVIKKIIGQVKLGVGPEDIGRISGLTNKGIYLMTFSPNPAERTEVMVTLSPAPAIYRADLEASTYANRQMAELNTGKYRLAFYDSNGRQMLIQNLENPTISNASLREIHHYSYSVDTTKLESGTYLAVILFDNNVVAGHGRLVVQR
jgi:aminopeptidase N